MKRNMLVIAAVVGAAGCVEGPAVDAERAPLIGGDVLGEDEFRAVVALVNGDAAFCTGTLVSPSVIATAGHCIDDGGDDFAAHFGSDTVSGGADVAVVAVRQHQMWTGELDNGYDIGLVLLQFPQDPALPVPMFDGNPLDYRNEPLERIGFGIYNRDTGAQDGKKRHFTTELTGVGEEFLTTQGSLDMSTCNGDSGGPAMVTVDGELQLIGVHSWGQGTATTDCIGLNGDTRVDKYRADWIQPWIDDNDPVCGMDGTCAPVGCSDDPDCQPCGPDGTCVTDCALPDPDCATQQIGEICEADTQCVDGGVCTWWQADPETEFCTRACDPGNDDCPSGMSCTSRPNIGNVCYYDADPPGVVGSECTTDAECGAQICADGVCVTTCDLNVGRICPTGFVCESRNQVDYFCWAEDGGGSGGCAVRANAAGDSAPWSLALALGLALWLARRRPRVSGRRARR